MVYFCDYLPSVLKAMEGYGLTNDDVQVIFNEGMSEGLNQRFLDRDGYRVGILFHYDGYTLRYVIESIYKRPLESEYARKVSARNRGK